MPKRLIALLFFALSFPSSLVFAQSIDRLVPGVRRVKDLKLPTEPSSLGFFSQPKLALYKPQGNGPFPALVLHHQCGGLRAGNWQNMSMLNWAKEAVAKGYVVLLLDSLEQRRADSVCFSPQGGVTYARGLMDALQAAEHLRKLPYVDKNRVAFAGFSWGAGVGLLASSGKAVQALGRYDRFNAIVSFYPPCYAKPADGSPPYDLATQGIDRPLLVLMGEQDNETPAEECIARLSPLKSAGEAVDWHVYPNTTHCWDCENLNGYRKVDVRGNTVVYRYDANTTRDSAQRMFSFMEKAFAAASP